MAPARPASLLSTGTWHTQEGATISQFDQSLSVEGTPQLVEQLTLVVSPYSTAYELNGVSNIGDWYQVVVADNWPACRPGFQEIIQVWNNSGGTGPTTCDGTVPLQAGDNVQLKLSFATNHNVCLSLWDSSTAKGRTVCLTPPDFGGNQFNAQSEQWNWAGYFSGPMTEVLNSTATDCPTYGNLPAVGYEFANSSWITGVIPWSDEWGSGGNGTLCYSSSETPVDLAGPSPVTHYLNTADQSSFGPRWAAVQNLSPVRPGLTLRYATDPILLSAVALTASASVVILGDSVTLNISGSGGVPPYRTMLLLNGSPLGIVPTSWTLALNGSGLYTFSAYLVDHTDAVYGPSSAVQVIVPGTLQVLSVGATPTPTGSDVGQVTSFSVDVSGGVGARIFAWSGLPSGCVTVSRPSLTCMPTLPGTSQIQVRVSDQNGADVLSAPLPFRVSPALHAVLNATRSVADVSQTIGFRANTQGGSGELSFSWTGLPAGCVGPAGPSVACLLTSAGFVAVGVTVMDSNGFSALSNPLAVMVFPALSVNTSSDRTSVDTGVPILLSAAVSGGAGGTQFAWVGLASECGSGVGPSVNCTPQQGGIWTVVTSVTDLSGAIASSTALSIEVYPAPLVRLSSDSPTIAVGQRMTFTAVVVGGGPGIHYVWGGLPSGCTAFDRASITCSPSVTGNFRVTAAVSDSTGSTVTESMTFHVTSAAPGGLLGLLTPPVVTIAALGIVAAGGIAVFAMLRRAGRMARKR